MNFRRDQAGNSDAAESREEVRELAEALSLYRSAMTHLADRFSAHPRLATPRRAHPFRLRLLLGPALGVALAAGVLAPLYGHLHQHTAAVLRAQNNPAPDPTATRASVDDTILMNQIDNQLSETVPDALAPLADLSAQAATQSSVSETKP